jgi:hypothetical protein
MNSWESDRLVRHAWTTFLVPDIVRGLAVAIPDHGLGLRETRVGKSLISDPHLAENFRSDLDGVGIGIDDYFLPAYK